MLFSPRSRGARSPRRDAGRPASRERRVLDGRQVLEQPAERERGHADVLGQAGAVQAVGLPAERRAQPVEGADEVVEHLLARVVPRARSSSCTDRRGRSGRLASGTTRQWAEFARARVEVQDPDLKRRARGTPSRGEHALDRVRAVTTATSTTSPSATADLRAGSGSSATTGPVATPPAASNAEMLRLAARRRSPCLGLQGLLATARSHASRSRPG